MSELSLTSLHKSAVAQLRKNATIHKIRSDELKNNTMRSVIRVARCLNVLSATVTFRIHLEDSVSICGVIMTGKAMQSWELLHRERYWGIYFHSTVLEHGEAVCCKLLSVA